LAAAEGSSHIGVIIVVQAAGQSGPGAVERIKVAAAEGPVDGAVVVDCAAADDGIISAGHNGVVIAAADG